MTTDKPLSAEELTDAEIMEGYEIANGCGYASLDLYLANFRILRSGQLLKKALGEIELLKQRIEQMEADKEANG